MTYCFLIRQILYHYNNNNYMMALSMLDKYFSQSINGLYEDILDIYINCLIKLGMYDKAILHIDIMRSLFPNNYDSFQLAMLYSSCGSTSELRKLIDSNEFSDLCYYRIAKNCFYNGLYEISEELFNKFLLVTEEEDFLGYAREYLSRLELYKNNDDAFTMCSYSFFRANGGKLVPGHIIYVNRVRDDYQGNLYISDPKKDKRPYMIWKISGKKIYGFPVSRQIEGRKAYVLHKEKYPNHLCDRIVKNNLVCLSLDDVDSIIDIVSEEDYVHVIDDIYNSICLMHEEVHMNNSYFVNEMIKRFNIKKNDVIVIRLNDYRINKYYFVLDIEKDNYHVLEVKKNSQHGFEFVDMSLVDINTKTLILKTIRLDEEEKNRLLSQINNYSDENNIVKKRVLVDNRK